MKMQWMLLVAGLSLIATTNCGYEPTVDEQRFEITFYSEQGHESCIVRVLKDKQTGCQYLAMCNALTAMPHTCFLDKALTDKTLGN